MTQVLWPSFQVFCLFLLQSGDFSDITNWPTPGELANKEVISIIHLFVHLFCVYLFFLMPIHPSLLPVIIRQSCSCISTCLDQLTPSPIHTHAHAPTCVHTVPLPLERFRCGVLRLPGDLEAVFDQRYLHVFRNAAQQLLKASLNNGASVLALPNMATRWPPTAACSACYAHLMISPIKQ